MDEVDMYDQDGNQVNDINTLVQFVDQAILGHERKAHSDSDDDQAHFFSMLKVQQFVINPVICFNSRKQEFEPAAVKLMYGLFNDRALQSIAHDVLAPPPKA